MVNKVTLSKSYPALKNKIYIQLLGKIYYHEFLHVHYRAHEVIFPGEAQSLQSE
jgi:hypothetical protein